MSIPHPIPYQGSKRNLAQSIIRYFPENTTRLIEPFAGSAAVTLAAAHYQKAETFYINDSNAPLMRLWQSIIQEPETIARGYAELWQAQLGQERAYYDQVREHFNHTQEPHHLLYLLARCVKSAVRYNAQGHFNQSPDNRRKGTQPQKMRGHLIDASMLLRNRIQTTDGKDYREVLEEAGPSDLVYMDPPYQGVCGKRDTRYMSSDLGHTEFVEALRYLNTRGVPYLVTYDGRTGDKTFGNELPEDLGLERIEVLAGRSSQATLLGRDDHTFESLYLSPLAVGACVSQSREHHPSLDEGVTCLERNGRLGS